MSIMETFITKNAKLLAAGLVALMLSSTESQAQGPGGRSFGFGLVLIDPLGASVKFWINPVNALVFDIGASDFGPTRLDADYLWHFDAFQSRIVKMYAGPGLVLAFGNGIGPYGAREFGGPYNGVGVGIRAMFGLNVIPVRTPLEMFFGLGPLIGLSPSGVGLDIALGIRFYP
jgi:hypothetical protein